MRRSGFKLGFVAFLGMCVALAVPASTQSANPPKAPTPPKPPKTVNRTLSRVTYKAPTTGTRTTAPRTGAPTHQSVRIYHVFARLPQGGSRMFNKKSDAQHFVNALRQARIPRTMSQVGKNWLVKFRASSGWRHVGASRNLRTASNAVNILRHHHLAAKLTSQRIM